MTTYADLENAGWGIGQQTWNDLSAYEKRFAAVELTGERTFDYYRRRLEMVGFTGLDKVLDAACGLGQWAMLMAELNGAVVGVDTNATRIKVAQQLAGSLGYENASFETGSIEYVAKPDASFDGVFCYGAFMFTNTQSTLREFHRLLKPGGKLYLNVNSYGWLLHLLFDRALKAEDFSAFSGTCKMAWNSLIGAKKNSFFSQTRLEKLLNNEGFEITACGVEGSIDVNQTKPVHYSTYAPSHYGLPSIIEVLATKSAG